MIRICILCEGQTEETFVRDVLSPLFIRNNIDLKARGIRTSKNQKGGGLVYQRVRNFLIRTLKEDKNQFVTTFFDLYALDKNFPDIEKIKHKVDPYQKAAILEDAFKADLIKDYPEFSSRFIPYIQPYEFEGLLFSDIQKLVEIESDWSSYLECLQAIAAQFETPEHINNSYETKPSERIKKILPRYNKPLHGPLAIEDIGIDKVLIECKHFSKWYSSLLQLAQ